MTEAEIAALHARLRETANRTKHDENAEDIVRFVRALMARPSPPLPGHLSSEDAEQLVRAIRADRDAE